MGTFETEKAFKDHYRAQPVFLGEGGWRRFAGGDGRIMDDLYIRPSDARIVLVEAKLHLKGDQTDDKPGGVARKLRRAGVIWRVDEHEALRVAVSREDRTKRRAEIDAAVGGGWSRAWQEPPVFFVTCPAATDTARKTLVDAVRVHLSGPERWLAGAYLAVGPGEDGAWEVVSLAGEV